MKKVYARSFAPFLGDAAGATGEGHAVVPGHHAYLQADFQLSAIKNCGIGQNDLHNSITPKQEVVSANDKFSIWRKISKEVPLVSLYRYPY